MQHLLMQTLEGILAGEPLGPRAALKLALGPECGALPAVADELRQRVHGDHFSLCSILNARSGNCSEDCRYCAQSARHRTGAPSYAFIEADQALEIARDNGQHGVARISLVCSGRGVDETTLARMEPLYHDIIRETGLACCASAGLLSLSSAARLRAMGVTRYHCNLESSRSFFPKVCTTHGYEDKVATLECARQAGMSLCSGGIIGMGESMAQRIELAVELRELGVRSIPLNILTPIPGTPLAAVKPPPLQEILTTVALFRLLNPEAVIRIAGGRQQYGGAQYRLFRAGANGAIVGNYLTTRGNTLASDLREIRACGFSLPEARHGG